MLTQLLGQRFFDRKKSHAKNRMAGSFDGQMFSLTFGNTHSISTSAHFRG